MENHYYNNNNNSYKRNRSNSSNSSNSSNGSNGSNNNRRRHKKPAPRPYANTNTNTNGGPAMAPTSLGTWTDIEQALDLIGNSNAGGTVAPATVFPAFPQNNNDTQSSGKGRGGGGRPQRNNPGTATFMATLAMMSVSLLPQSVVEVFTEFQCDAILWLALHGVPISAITYVVHQLDFKAPRPVNSLSGVMNMIEHYIVELAQGQGWPEDPDMLVARLLDVSVSRCWGLFRLRMAAQYIEAEDLGIPMTTGRKSRNEEAKERNMLAKGQFGSNVSNSLRVTQLLHAFGYRDDGSDDVEFDLMRSWLLQIRRDGQLTACA